MLQRSDFLEMSIREFLETAAADEPTPGGGGISALVGALAASMAEMALSFTVGRKKFAAVADEAEELKRDVADIRLCLETLVVEDAAGYGRFSQAMKMPRSTPEEKESRRQAMKSAMQQALEPPMEMLRTMRRLARLLGRILEVGNPNLAGDTAVCAAILPGAARAASLNVWQNISAFDSDSQADLSAEIDGALAEIEDSCIRVRSQVEETLCPRPKADPS